MKRIVLFILALMVVAVPAFAHEGVRGNVTSLVESGVLPDKCIDLVDVRHIVANFSHVGSESRHISFNGITKSLSITVYGCGTKLSQANTTEIAADNMTAFNVNFTYYPRSATLTFVGYMWWNSSNQHIVNSSATIATISDSDGSFAVSDDYTSENPIWDSIGDNITVNTTAGWLEHSVDTAAETVRVVYNITIDDGYFTSMTWNNVSVYVAVNATAGTGQDDLNIYYSTDGGSTWVTLFDGADGSTSTGTQWTGDVELPISGNSTVLIEIEFVSDGADDDAANADVYIDAINITGTVSKLPTRNPKVDINNDGVWDYSYTGVLNNSTTSTPFSLCDVLNLSNTFKVYAEGSQKVKVNLTWYDEGRLHVITVGAAGDTETVDKFVAAGENVSVSFNVTRYFAPVTVTITLDEEHTLCRQLNYSIDLESYKFMLLSDSVATVSPEDGVHVQSYKASSEPVPIFVKPDKDLIAVAVNLFNPDARAGDIIASMTISSERHDNTVDIIIGNLSYDKVEVFVDGNYYTSVNVTDGVAYFAITGFSTHDVDVYAPGAALIAPVGVDWSWIAALIVFVILNSVLIYLLVATWRKGTWRT
jgi:hypothetical protein